MKIHSFISAHDDRERALESVRTRRGNDETAGTHRIARRRVAVIGDPSRASGGREILRVFAVVSSSS
jgi:hypothetical protein